MNATKSPHTTVQLLVVVTLAAALGACSSPQRIVRHAKSNRPHTAMHAAAGQTSDSAARDSANGNESEVLVTLASLPASVRAALAGITPDSQVLQVTRDLKAGQTVYDVVYSKNGEQWAAGFSATGAVLENEQDGEDGDEDEDGDNHD